MLVVIAGAELFTGNNLVVSTITWSAFLVKNLVPVTIGNVIGGAVFVGLGYWGAYLRPSK
ncbi:formate/nitrite transporter family protein [Desulfosarcina ovata]|uniref:Formate/nitrite transporter n=1 Tax=Desulfosarcina ovata subsp. ovata TaxID=2752305 RepID=A0A5K8ABE3_9BACT|nr:formate/nitrite transporter family protein [Desulfosarcina ovata]BBO89364.1 hypothetical protein DSCOOX_25440 [Desulfosarcina ovata subsp. ovata]